MQLARRRSPELKKPDGLRTRASGRLECRCVVFADERVVSIEPTLISGETMFCLVFDSAPPRRMLFRVDNRGPPPVFRIARPMILSGFERGLWPISFRHTIDRLDDAATQVLSGFRWTATVRLLSQVITWAITLVVIRLLTPTDYGLLRWRRCSLPSF